MAPMKRPRLKSVIEDRTILSYNNSVIKKIISLKILDDYRLWLRFSDGAEGEVDFSLRPRTGVFAFWNSYENFRKAHIGNAGELIWNNQLDFCPDSLWLKVTGNKPEALLT